MNFVTWNDWTLLFAGSFGFSFVDAAGDDVGDGSFAIVVEDTAATASSSRSLFDLEWLDWRPSLRCPRRRCRVFSHGRAILLDEHSAML